MRGEAETEFGEIYKEAEKFAGLLGTTIEISRQAAKQTYRANIASSGPEEYFRRTILIPFLDHLMEQLRSRFGSGRDIPALALQELMLQFTREGTLDRVMTAVSTYEADLLSTPHQAKSEIRIWLDEFAGSHQLR